MWRRNRSCISFDTWLIMHKKARVYHVLFVYNNLIFFSKNLFTILCFCGILCTSNIKELIL